MAFNDLINDMIHFINEGFPMCTFAYRFNYPHSHLVIKEMKDDFVEGCSLCEKCMQRAYLSACVYMRA